MTESRDSFNAFAKDLYDVVSRSASAQNCVQGSNMIFSPASIQTSLMLAFVGAAGSTSEQLRKGLKLGPEDRQEIAKIYHDFWSRLSECGERLKLKTVTHFFVNEQLSVKPDFAEIALDYFQFKPQKMNFAQSAKATQQINTLVEQVTENKIRNLLQPDAVNAETSAVIVNALYFKGLFHKPFSPESTMPDDFYVNKKQLVTVDMMYQEDKFKYVELPDLDARAVALPFEDSDISMLIMLPNKICGLPELECKLNQLDFWSIDKNMQMQDVEIAMPKFTIEFDLDLKDTLQQLGITDLFGDGANLSRIFEEAKGQKISAAKHRGYIDVNEAGCEAAAVSVLKVVPMSLNMNKETFKVDHPFLFLIRSSKAIFFVGRYLEPQQKNYFQVNSVLTDSLLPLLTR
ncbi:serine protease inhibitor 42Dd [Drosophila grimshawi]|uniref:GH22013 n=1 Tax=Drosophila grimshawi TaxID=7222 RepID=B4J9H4_DROGR|nr:serine protease inhibitor 42Dd [Drosophila grimshawi]EDW02481.1 GH22013 [Drosophila grimshawi]